MTRTVSTCGVSYCRQKKKLNETGYNLQSSRPEYFPSGRCSAERTSQSDWSCCCTRSSRCRKLPWWGWKEVRTAAVLMRTDLKNSQDSPHRRQNTQVQEKSEIKRTNGDYVPLQKSQVSKALAEMGLSRTSTWGRALRLVVRAQDASLSKGGRDGSSLHNLA